MLQVVNPDIQKLAHRTLDTRDPKNTVYLQVMLHSTTTLKHTLITSFCAGV